MLGEPFSIVVYDASLCLIDLYEDSFDVRELAVGEAALRISLRIIRRVGVDIEVSFIVAPPKDDVE